MGRPPLVGCSKKHFIHFTLRIYSGSVCRISTGSIRQSSGLCNIHKTSRKNFMKLVNILKVWNTWFDNLIPGMALWKQTLLTCALGAAVSFEMLSLWSYALRETMVPLPETVLKIWTLFYYQLMHTTLKNAELLKHSKLDKNSPTCFGLHRNHLQGAKVSAWLKITRLVNSICVF